MRLRSAKQRVQNGSGYSNGVDLETPPGDPRRELEATLQARDTVPFLLLDPPLPPAARLSDGALAANAVSLLPRWRRKSYHCPGSRRWTRALCARTTPP